MTHPSDPASGLGPSAVGAEQVFLRHADPDHALAGVGLWVDQDVELERRFAPVTGGWELAVPIPPVGRLEYLFELTQGTDRALTVDQGNPLRVAGAFGDHSWLPMPGYHEPEWLTAPGHPGQVEPFTATTAVGAVTGSIWSPENSAETPLPWLISHDGPEMDQYGRLTQFVAAGIQSGTLPAMRVVLLAPGARNTWYAAHPPYAAALVTEVLPAVRAQVAVSGSPILMGQSLGGLAALHAGWCYPDAFAAVFCQSGSFFTPVTDPQESGFETWDAIVAFTTELHTAAASPGSPARPPVTVVCGRAEENLANNLLVASDLTRAGVEVCWGDLADGHTWTCWRDLLDPHLGDLVRRVWPTPPRAE